MGIAQRTPATAVGLTPAWAAERGEQVVLRWEQRDGKLRLLQPYLNSSPPPQFLAQPFTFSGDNVFDPPSGLRPLILAIASFRQPHNTPAFTSPRPPLATTLRSVLVFPCVLPPFSDSISLRQKVLFIGVHYRLGWALPGIDTKTGFPFFIFWDSSARAPSQEGGALHPTTWRPSCDLTSSSPAHGNASTATCTNTTALTYSNKAHRTTTSMANINWRTINIDALDPDSPANFDLSSLTPAVEPVSTADVQDTAQQIRQLLRGGDNEGALQGALEAPPYGADDKGKEVYLAIVLEVLQSIRQAEIAQMLSRIYGAPGGTESLDVLMKYIYKGMAQAAPASNARNVTPQATGFSQVHSRGGGEGGGQAMSVLLSWHEKLVEVAGPGSIVRVMTDRRTV
ncbi:hypothetical protein OPT61_g1343 [Boeremia exigua]|uniref:Uncharacterized protein n=1 Tax=Boeremia exigua TaxID=749465 RepID=A0ACC2IQY9_9PLEO|nr:hypothetical protein OPT61_g1343 [Boeremia exigua]